MIVPLKFYTVKLYLKYFFIFPNDAWNTLTVSVINIYIMNKNSIEKNRLNYYKI